MCHATVIVQAVTQAAALGGVDGFIYGTDDLSDRNRLGIFRQAITAAWAAYALYQCMPA